MADVTKDQVVDFLSNLNIMELMALKTELEDKWGVDASAAVAIAAGPAVGGAAEAVEEKDEFDVVLTGFGDKKIQVIKAVRELTSMGLKEAKDLVEGAPATVKEAATKEEAEAMKAKIEEAGGSVDLK
jgi:large subunit ribosomal protein L7/L12